MATIENTASGFTITAANGKVYRARKTNPPSANTSRVLSLARWDGKERTWHFLGECPNRVAAIKRIMTIVELES